ncbi:MAG: MarR family transcriptional regulator [Fimbriimonadaceae bacterium]|nr:MarR family transcriptional regulator [Fimbriimonadaceae bacterium]
MNLTEAIPVKHRALRAMLQTSGRIIRTVSKRLDDAGHVSAEVYDVLVTLEYEATHRMRLSQLADEIVLSRSGLSRLIDRMERDGLIRREECPGDRRGTYAVLTEAGLAARQSAWPTVEAELAELWNNQVTEAEAAKLLKIFSRITVTPAEGSKKPSRKATAL